MNNSGTVEEIPFV